MSGPFSHEKAAVFANVAHQLARFISLGSNVHGDHFALGVAGSVARTQFTGRFDDKSNGLFQITSSLGESPALRIHTRDFFNGGDVAPSALLNDRSELSLHG